MNHLTKSKRNNRSVSVNHSPIKDNGRVSKISPLIESIFDSLHKLYLTIVGLYTRTSKETVIFSVVDQIWIINNDCLVTIMIKHF